MRALVIQKSGEAAVAEAPKPSMRPGYIRVKPVAVALNPTDFHHIDYAGVKGNIIGCDYAGWVDEVGENHEEGLAKGDKVFGVIHGANKSNLEDGADGEYAMQREGLVSKIPDGMSFEVAATLGGGILTIGQSLYQALELPLPNNPASSSTPILIYGGSTATGTLAIQFAKLSGLTVLTTCSPRHFDLVKSRGADEAFDYTDPSCAEKIRKATGNQLYKVLDCICTESTQNICAQALASNSSSGLKYVGLLDVKDFPRKDVDTQWTLAYTAFGEAFSKLGMDFAAKPDDYEHARMFWALASDLVSKGTIVPHPAEVREGGLEGILQGLEDLRHGRVRGVKLVYRI